MTRWQANTGRGERVAETKNRPGGAAEKANISGNGAALPSGARSSGDRQSAQTRLLRLLRTPPETEDLLLSLVLYLLYRESGDRDWLVMLAGLLFG